MTTRRDFIEKVSKGLAATAIFGPSILDALAQSPALPALVPPSAPVSLLVSGHWYQVCMHIGEEGATGWAVDLATGERTELPVTHEGASYEINVDPNVATIRCNLGEKHPRENALSFSTHVKRPERLLSDTNAPMFQVNTASYIDRKKNAWTFSSFKDTDITFEVPRAKFSLIPPRRDTP